MVSDSEGSRIMELDTSGTQVLKLGFGRCSLRDRGRGSLSPSAQEKTE